MPWSGDRSVTRSGESRGLRATRADARRLRRILQQALGFGSSNGPASRSKSRSPLKVLLIGRACTGLPSASPVMDRTPPAHGRVTAGVAVLRTSERGSRRSHRSPVGAGSSATGNSGRVGGSGTQERIDGYDRRAPSRGWSALQVIVPTIRRDGGRGRGLRHGVPAGDARERAIMRSAGRPVEARLAADQRRRGRGGRMTVSSRRPRASSAATTCLTMVSNHLQLCEKRRSVESPRPTCFAIAVAAGPRGSRRS